MSPPERIDWPGAARDRNRRRPIPALERDTAAYCVTRANTAGDAGNPYPDESREANLLADHPTAPD